MLEPSFHLLGSDQAPRVTEGLHRLFELGLVDPFESRSRAATPSEVNRSELSPAAPLPGRGEDVGPAVVLVARGKNRAIQDFPQIHSRSG